MELDVLDLVFCDHCDKMIPPSATANIWRDAVVCDTCVQILRSVTTKTLYSGDSMVRGMAVQEHTPRHIAREHKTRCNHCRKQMAHNAAACPSCKRAVVKSYMDILPL